MHKKYYFKHIEVIKSMLLSVKIKILLFIVMIFNPIYNSSAQEQTVIPANDPLIEYCGRIDFTNPNKPSFGYSGVSIRAAFTGTKISMLMHSADIYYNIIIDNTSVQWINVNPSKTEYELASGLKDTIHEIEIFKSSEIIFGNSEFEGFILEPGKSLVKITNPRTKLIEFIGNSITCGYGNITSSVKEYSPLNQDHYLTYAAIVSRSFNANHLAVCKSGIGVYRNWAGSVDENPDCMPKVYDRIFYDKELPKYSFDKKPDLICIDLGTNDFSEHKGDSAKFVNAYINFIEAVQDKNKSADILCLLGPMIGTNDLPKMRNYFKYIIETANAKGKGKVLFFEMSAQTGDLGVGVDGHPTALQHIRNGIELVNHIHELKGWEIIPQLLYAELISTDQIELFWNSPVKFTGVTFSGFKVITGNKNIPIKSVISDKDNRTHMHLLLSENILSYQKVALFYKRGKTKSFNKIKIQDIFNFSVSNKLVISK